MLSFLTFRQKRRAPSAPHTNRATAESNRSGLLVAFAGQTGTAEMIAWKTAQAARQSGTPATLLSLDSAGAEALASAAHALFVVSTTGNGDPPDNARAFARHCMKRPARLSSLRYCMLALGDRSYSRFCGFGRRLDGWLADSHAEPMAPRIEVDNSDAAALEAWFRQLGALGLAAPDAALARRYSRWKLLERTVLNGESADAPVYLVALSPVDPPPTWQAGDIAEVFPGPVSLAFADVPDLAPRDYTLASLPGNGRIELVVRRRATEGGGGHASAWLTERAPVGERVALRIRTNSQFHAPPGDAPMILIGSGTGIAGLRAHLKERQASGRGDNWLIFGERTSSHDWLFRAEIESWRSSGHITRLDTAFSRDDGDRAYVQDRLLEAREELLEWVERKASIYVCGSRHGMADGVARALTAVIGEARLESMAAEQRYRRDVY